MWVDITSLIQDTGVGQYINIKPLPAKTNTGDFGVANNDDVSMIENVYCTLVENIDDVVDSHSGSYISRVTYDFYIPYKICLENKLKGATIYTGDGRQFIVTHEPINRRYVSHCVVTAAEYELRNGGGANVSV